MQHCLSCLFSHQRRSSSYSFSICRSFPKDMLVSWSHLTWQPSQTRHQKKQANFYCEYALWGYLCDLGSQQPDHPYQPCRLQRQNSKWPTSTLVREFLTEQQVSWIWTSCWAYWCHFRGTINDSERTFILEVAKAKKLFWNVPFKKKKKRLLKNYLFFFKSQCLAVSIRFDASDVMWFGAIQNLHEIFKWTLQKTNSGIIRDSSSIGSVV